MIKFGTDGWRAKIAEDFTFENVAKAAAATARYIKNNGKEKQGFVIGYDHRFLSEEFAEISANILSQYGINVYLTNKPVPTQLVSFAVKKLKTFGGIMITASHNPYVYNGFKLKIDKGCSAPPEVTKAIEKELENEGKINYNEKNTDLIKLINVDLDYVKHISRSIDVKRIKKSKTKAIVDLMHGSGAGYFPLFGRYNRLSFGGNTPQIEEIFNHRDALFGGRNPEPLAYNLESLLKIMKKKRKWHLGIALDGDADRLGAAGSNGRFINSQEVYILLLYHLIKNRNMKGDIVKAFNMTSMINPIAEENNIKVHETKIGFKYIADEILTHDILLGGEESGGYAVKGHLPERDGIFNGLLLMELVACEKKQLEKILDKLYKKYGYFYYGRYDLHIEDNNKKEKIVSRFFSNPPEKISQKPVTRKEDLDGLKLFFNDGAWILFRVSGTEPLIRIYVESRNKKDLEILLKEGKKILLKHN